jgi:HSP20 family protein
MANKRADDFDPIKSLNSIVESVSRLVESGLNAGIQAVNTSLSGANALPVDMLETETTIVVKAGPLLGVTPSDIDVSITADALTIKGQMHLDSDPDAGEGVYLRRERKAGSFSRTVKIPKPVVAEQADAKFQNNMLTIILPKVEEPRPKIINIKSADV